MAIDRIVMGVAGGFVLISVILSVVHSPHWLWFTAFVGANLLQAAPKIDGLWNHDDDQGVGVMAAIEAAGRDEFVMVGGAGSGGAGHARKLGSGCAGAESLVLRRLRPR